MKIKIKDASGRIQTLEDITFLSVTDLVDGQHLEINEVDEESMVLGFKIDKKIDAFKFKKKPSPYGTPR